MHYFHRSVFTCKYTTKNQTIMKKIRNFICNVLLIVIVGSAAAIHIAYRVWYFKKYLIRPGRPSTSVSTQQETPKQ